MMTSGDTTWYRGLRRSDRALGSEDAMALLGRNYYGVLSLAWPDGSPYAVPINYGYDGASNTIFMHCAAAGQKLDILRRNPKAAFSVVEMGPVIQGDVACATSISFRSVMAFGQVIEVRDQPGKLHGLQVICAACGVPAPASGSDNAADFAKRAEATAVLALRIEHCSGKVRS